MSKPLPRGTVPQPHRIRKATVAKPRDETPEGCVLHVHGRGAPPPGTKYYQKTLSFYPVLLHELAEKCCGRNETALYNVIIAYGLSHFLKHPSVNKTVREHLVDALGEEFVARIEAEGVEFVE